MAFSKEARKSAAMARKIKSRLGEAAYNEYRKTGKVPAGLDSAPSAAAKAKAKRVPSSPEAAGAQVALNRADQILADAAKRAKEKIATSKITVDEKTKQLARSLPNLADRNFLTAMKKQQKATGRERFVQIARAQAIEALTDKAFIDHYKDTKVFVRRGEKPESVAQMRDELHRGGRVPLWAIPAGTKIALYRDTIASHPDMVATVVGHTERVPEGLTTTVPYVRFKDEDGLVYEYPALLGGGKKSPQAQFAAFAGVDAIENGQSFVPSLGFSFPNFYVGADAGPSGAPEDIDGLVKGMQRALSWARATEERRAKKQLEKAGVA